MPFTRQEVRNILGESHTEEIESKLFNLYLGEKDVWKEKLDNLTSDNKRLKVSADKLEEVQKELDGLKGSEDWKTKYENEHSAFEAFKTSVAEKETLEKKRAAYSKLLADEQINEKHIKDVLRLTDFSKVKLDKDGNLEDVDELKKAIGEEWSEYKVKTTVRKQQVINPPASDVGSGSGRAKELYLNHLRNQGVKIDTGKE